MEATKTKTEHYSCRDQKKNHDINRNNSSVHDLTEEKTVNMSVQFIYKYIFKRFNNSSHLKFRCINSI